MNTKKIAKIIKNNPAIRADELAEGLAAVRSLRKLGLKPKGYSLRSPYLSGRRLRTFAESSKAATRIPSGNRD